MLTRHIIDKYGVEERRGVYQGLGFIPTDTHFLNTKVTQYSRGHIVKHLPHIGGIPVEGYEIHHGQTTTHKPFAILGGKEDGYYDNRIVGTYLHGLFHNKAFSEQFFNMVRRERGYSSKPFYYVSPIQETDTVLSKIKDRIESLLEEVI